MSSFSRDDRLVRAADRPEVEVDGEVVLLDLTRDEYQTFGGTARRIWELLAHPVTMDDLCAALAREYDAPSELLRADTERFLRELHTLGLVRVADGG